MLILYGPMAVDELDNRIAYFVSARVKDGVPMMELPFEQSIRLIAGQMYWWRCELMGEFPCEHLGAEIGLVGEPDTFVVRVVPFCRLGP